MRLTCAILLMMCSLGDKSETHHPNTECSNSSLLERKLRFDGFESVRITCMMGMDDCGIMDVQT